MPALDDPIQNPAGVRLDALAVVADAVSTPFSAISRADLRPGDLAVWIGAGGVGGFGVQISAALGAHVLAIDINQTKLDSLAQYGASLTINSAVTDVKSIRRRVREFAESHSVPPWRYRIFESSGHPAGQSLAWALLAHGAVLSVVGFTPLSVEIRLSNLMAFDGTAQGNWGCLPELYPQVVDLVLAGKVVLEPFIDRRPMSTINDVFQELHHGAVSGRIVLIPDAATTAQEVP